jgi:hypothetical protein
MTAPRLTPVGAPGRITAWDTKPCRTCGRDRVHWRDRSNVWHCIGTLRGAADKCGAA